MEALGKIGNFYIVLLFGLLIAGVGILSLNFSRKIWSSTESFLDKKGGKLMNKWLKLAIVAFSGLLIASFALGLTNSVGSGTDSSMAGMSGMNGMSGMSGSSADGSGAASSQNHAAHHPGAQPGTNDASAANWAGYAQGMNNAGGNMGMNGMGYGMGYGTGNTMGYGMGYNSTGSGNVEAQMYMMQHQIHLLQQQLSHMVQMYNQQGNYPGPMGMPGYQNQTSNPGMNNMNNMSNMNNMGNSNSSMGSQSSSGNSGGGMGMM